MPLIGLGTWQLRGQAGYNAMRLALEVGYRHIDTATMYRNEADVGLAVRDSGILREEIFVTTKLPPERAARASQTLAESLRALQLDYVDLWLVHWPPSGGASPGTWQEFVAARRGGLARAIGVSNYSTRQCDELIDATGQAPAVNQIRWGPALYEPKRLAELRDRRIVLEGYSPFKSTNLRSPVLTEIAAVHGVSPAQVVLRWHVEHGVVAIPKSADPDRLRLNLDVFGFALSAAEIAQIDSLGRP